MSTTSGVGATTAATTSTTTSTSATRETSLGQDAFLQLLTTQLAHQDPTQPRDDGEFIAQLAQFSSVEQLTQINQTLEQIQTALGIVDEA